MTKDNTVSQGKGKTCCEWHDALPDFFGEDSVPEDNKMFGEAPECGLAGMGTPSVCCRKCPQANWFIKKRGVTPYFVKEIMELPIEERP